MIIGSTAIKYWFPDFKRECKDVDIIKDMYIEDYSSNLKIEWLENPVLKNYFVKPIDYITPNELYTLKISHLFWNINWEKHIYDVQFLRNKSCILINSLFYDLYNYWSEYHGKNKRSDLKMSSNSFFNNALKYPIEHDTLHEILIQHSYFENQDKPTYSKILKENQEIDVCMDKFKDLSNKEKFNLVFEEVAVMAIERFPEEMYYKIMFNKMLKKFIISHCKIEEAIWIIENHKKIVTNIPFDFKEYLKNEIKLWKKK